MLLLVWVSVVSLGGVVCCFVFGLVVMVDDVLLVWLCVMLTCCLGVCIVLFAS